MLELGCSVLASVSFPFANIVWFTNAGNSQVAQVPFSSVKPWPTRTDQLTRLRNTGSVLRLFRPFVPGAIYWCSVFLSENRTLLRTSTFFHLQKESFYNGRIPCINGDIIATTSDRCADLGNAEAPSYGNIVILPTGAPDATATVSVPTTPSRSPEVSTTAPSTTQVPPALPTSEPSIPPTSDEQVSTVDLFTYQAGIAGTIVGMLILMLVVFIVQLTVNLILCCRWRKTQETLTMSALTSEKYPPGDQQKSFQTEYNLSRENETASPYLVPMGRIFHRRPTQYDSSQSTHLPSDAVYYSIATPGISEERYTAPGSGNESQAYARVGEIDEDDTVNDRPQSHVYY